MYPPGLEQYFDRTGSNPTALSGDMGRSRNYIKNLFANSQEHLVSYMRLANAHPEPKNRKSILQLADLIERQKVSGYLDSIKQALGVESNLQLAKRTGISNSFIAQLYKEPGSLNGIKNYVDLARFIHCEAEELLMDSQSERVSA